MHMRGVGRQHGGPHASGIPHVRRGHSRRRQNASGLHTKYGTPSAHVFSVVSHRLGLTLTQPAVDDKTHAIKAIETVLAEIVLTGRVLTMEVMLTQRQVAQTIMAKGGGSVMSVKAHPPTLQEEIALVFTLPPAGERQEYLRTVDTDHGRMETRNLSTSEALVGYSDWPGCRKCLQWGVT